MDVTTSDVIRLIERLKNDSLKLYHKCICRDVFRKIGEI